MSDDLLPPEVRHGGAGMALLFVTQKLIEFFKGSKEEAEAKEWRRATTELLVEIKTTLALADAANRRVEADVRALQTSVVDHERRLTVMETKGAAPRTGEFPKATP